MRKVRYLYHTIKHLRFKQVYYRGYYRLFAQKNYAKNLPIQYLKGWTKPWSSPAFMPFSLTKEGEISFLGEKGKICTPADWTDSQRTKLWLYNLHYFDHLNSQTADQRQSMLFDLIDKWIRENPPIPSLGWEPYPLSLRIVNWVKWFFRHKNAVTQEQIHSLALQAEALSRQIEYHILANHLFANAKALVFAGASLTGIPAKNWLNLGLKLLDQELKEQFLPDGGHFELSPMYHSILLWDLCDLINLAKCTRLSALEKRKKSWLTLLDKGLVWLRSMIHTDKKIAFFNDAAFGIAADYADLLTYAKELGLKVKSAEEEQPLNYHFMQDTGYCSILLAQDSKAILDLASIGAAYQPGHAHADTLSFEMSLHGQRFLVNSGTSCYGQDAQRQYERSTKAHNTVSINEENSSEVWAGFRVARRAQPRLLYLEEGKERLFISAEHDGYKRLKGRNLHQRSWAFLPRQLVIKDRITGPYQEALARFYFHPEIKIEQKETHLIQATLPKGQRIMIKTQGNFRLETSFWYPEFGSKKNNICLVLPFKGQELITEINW